MKIHEVILEDDGDVTDTGHWQHDQQKFFDQIGLTDRLKKDPVARLGYEIAKNPKTGVIDAISDKNTYYNPTSGKGTSGEFQYNEIGSGTLATLGKMVKGLGQTPVTRDVTVGNIPPRTVDSSGYTTKPTQDLENYGEVLAHELGHVGSLYTQGIPQADRTKMDDSQIKTINTASSNNEAEQRYRDIQHTSPGSTQYNQSVAWLAQNKFNTPVTKYEDYENFGNQIMQRGLPSNVTATEKSAQNDLNNPEKLQSYIQDYHSGKTNESLKEHKMKINEIILEASSPAQQAAIAINMKKRGKKPKNEDAVTEAKKKAKKKGPKPTNPSLWSRAKSAARSKFDVYPSAYANAYASKWYKQHGGGWRS